MWMVQMVVVNDGYYDKVLLAHDGKSTSIVVAREAGNDV